jgi:hypothetical protein
MTPIDARQFNVNLKNLGFIYEGNDKRIDIAQVKQFDGFYVPCDWLDFRRSPEGLAFCTLKGIETEIIAVPDGWQFENSLSNVGIRTNTQDARDQFRYLRTDGNVDVFLEEHTNQEVYTGRISQESPGMFNISDVYIKGADLVFPYLIFVDVHSKNPDSERARGDIRQGRVN